MSEHEANAAGAADAERRRLAIKILTKYYFHDFRVKLVLSMR